MIVLHCKASSMKPSGFKVKASKNWFKSISTFKNVLQMSRILHTEQLFLMWFKKHQKSGTVGWAHTTTADMLSLVPSWVNGSFQTYDKQYLLDAQCWWGWKDLPIM